MRKPQERIYKIYTSLKYRVNHKKTTMDPKWYESFEHFKEWSTSYTNTKKLYRIDTSSGYTPDNCIWAENQSEVRHPKGRKEYFCSCGSRVARKGSNCKVCAGIKARKRKDYGKKEYRRDWALKKKYGITLDDVNRMFTEQQGKCLICSKQMELPTSSRGQGPDVMAVDHCHHTGKVRGLLCNACNKGIGHLNDDPALVTKALEYLQKDNM